MKYLRAVGFFLGTLGIYLAEAFSLSIRDWAMRCSWQSVYLVEFDGPRRRRVLVSVTGE